MEELEKFSSILEAVHQEENKFLIHEAAEELGISRQAVHQAIVEGRLRATRDPRWTITAEDLAIYQSRLRTGTYRKERETVSFAVADARLVRQAARLSGVTLAKFLRLAGLQRARELQGRVDQTEG